MNIYDLARRLRMTANRFSYWFLHFVGEGVERGDQRYVATDWHGAYRAYRTHLIHNPGDSRVWLQAADCAAHVADTAGHIFSLRQALLLGADDVRILTGAARLYAARGYLLTARACLLRARQQEPHLALESFERKERSKESIPSGSRLFLDVTDMLAFFRNSVRKTGMQRLQAGILTSLVERNISGDIVFASFNEGLGDFQRVSSLLTCELIDASNADGAKLYDLQVILDQLVIHAAPLKCRKGDRYIVLGAFWFGNGYLARLGDLRRDGASTGIYFHDLIPYSHPEYVDEGTQRAFTEKLAEAVSKIDFACTNSAFVAGELRKLFATLERRNVPVLPVPLAHDISTSDSNETVTEAFKLSVPPEYVLCVGTIEPRKNHQLLLSIWTRLRESYGDRTPPLLIVGKWGWRIEVFREKLAASKNVEGKIVVREGLSDGELEYLYRNCLFTIFPSFAEGWGLPVGESLYFGKPCLASNSSSIPEVGGDLVRYFDPSDAEEAYRMVDAVLSDRNDLARWTELVRTTFKPRSWDQVTDNLIGQISRLEMSDLGGDSAPESEAFAGKPEP